MLVNFELKVKITSTYWSRFLEMLKLKVARYYGERKYNTSHISLKCNCTLTVERLIACILRYQKAIDTMENALLRTASYFKRTGLVAVLYLLFSGTPKSLTASSARTLRLLSFALVPKCGLTDFCNCISCRYELSILTS